MVVGKILRSGSAPLTILKEKMGLKFVLSGQIGEGKMKKSILFMSVAVLLMGQSLFAGVSYTFDCVTNDIAGDATVGETQLVMEVTETTAGADFKFTNTGPSASIISEIYFFDGVLLEISAIDESCSGVDFEDIGDKVSPGHLPGYDPDPLEVFRATEPESGAHNGVDPDEWVTVSYILSGSFQDLVDNLANGDVAVGVHVTAFESGGSESFVNIPEPATMALLGLGALLLRRKK